MDGSSNMIDLSSPDNNTKGNAFSSVPLIPCVTSTEPMISNNPFDAISEQVNYNMDDPFEMVYNKAYCNSKVEKKTNTKKTELSPVLKSSASQKTVSNVSVVRSEEANPILNSATDSLPTSQTQELPVLKLRAPEKSTSNFSMTNSEESSSLLSRATVSLPASQTQLSPVLNLSGSHKSASECSMAGFDESNCTLNRATHRLPSQTQLSSVSKFSGSQKSFSDFSVASSMESNSVFNRALICSSNTATPQVQFIKKQVVSPFVCDDYEDDDVFIEAKKLALSFSDADAFDKLNSEEDLLKMNPVWDPVDSSDEENDLLRNDPALNLKFVSPKKTPSKKIEFSEAVLNFKKRRSTDPDLSSSVRSEENLSILPNDEKLKRSASFCNSETPKTVNLRRRSAALSAGLGLLRKQTGVVAVNEEEFSVKLKSKKNESENGPQKAMPLKATIPIEYMARPSAVKIADKKIVNAKVRTQQMPRTKHNSPATRGNKFVSPKPVAASTPNKPITLPAVTPVVSQSKRHNSVDSIQSANSGKPAAGKPPRSNSTSSILSTNKENINHVNVTPNEKKTILPRRLYNSKLSNLPRSYPNVAVNFKT